MTNLVAIVVGLAMVWAGGYELAVWRRRRVRFRRAPAVIIDRRAEPGSGTYYRAVLEFTTIDGRVVRSVSAMVSAPGPKIGKRVTVSYDPADPAGTADRVGVQRFKTAAAPFLLAGGAVFVVYVVITRVWPGG